MTLGVVLADVESVVGLVDSVVGQVRKGVGEVVLRWFGKFCMVAIYIL